MVRAVVVVLVMMAENVREHVLSSLYVFVLVVLEVHLLWSWAFVFVVQAGCSSAFLIRSGLTMRRELIGTGWVLKMSLLISCFFLFWANELSWELERSSDCRRLLDFLYTSCEFHLAVEDLITLLKTAINDKLTLAYQ